ncbi:OsmC family protein [Myroides odoratimimus]|uniref:OsmC family protein n=1 Tax=Myroides odoratimimus TaxID=76832 RepID=UPI0031019B45
MSVTIETLYNGNYQCSTSTPLNQEPIITKAVRFTPMNLFASAYGSCLLATIDHQAYKSEFPITVLKSQISMNMSNEDGNLEKIDIKLFFDGDYTDQQKQIIEESAKYNCHVGKSIDPSIVKEFEFVYN